MRTRTLTALLIALAAVPAGANVPPPDGGGGGGQDGKKVRELKPWKANFTYKVVRDSNIYPELNARSGVIARVIKGQWWRIDCQLQNVTQNGPVLWNHIPNVGWIADHNMKTYTDGRIEGSPTCGDPTGAHVWFKQPWAQTKQYRLVHTTPIRTRPGGAQRGSESLAKDAWTTIDCSGRTKSRGWVRVYRRPKVGDGWIPADALRFWQKGLPGGLPRCQGDPASRGFVTLGDSYAAGIGAGSYYEETCHRSYKAYWALLEQQLASGYVSQLDDFQACSGDKTGDVLDDQLERLNRDTGLVTLSIGGNDLGFSTVVKNCIKPGGTSCKESIASHFEGSDLRALEGKLDKVYRAVRAKAPNALVLVIGYPELVPRDHIDGCGAMDDTDAPYLHDAATKLNNVIDATVGLRPKFKFVGVVRAFLGHSACNKGATDWINGISPGLAGGDGSFHPNVLGNRAIAARIKAAAPRFFR